MEEDPSSPDTGQLPNAAHGAGAAIHTSNNSSSSYNLVSSLLNLTKSPVSPPFVHSSVCLCLC